MPHSTWYSWWPDGATELQLKLPSSPACAGLGHLAIFSATFTPHIQLGAGSWELELLYKVPSDSFRDTKHFDQGHTAREGEGLVLGSLLQYCQLTEYQKPFKSCSVI